MANVKISLDGRMAAIMQAHEDHAASLFEMSDDDLADMIEHVAGDAQSEIASAGAPLPKAGQVLFGVVMPSILANLREGGRDMSPDDASDFREAAASALSDPDLRATLRKTAGNLRRNADPDGALPVLFATEILSRPVVQGNILEHAVSRLAPPRPEDADAHAVAMRTASQRLGLSVPRSSWHPEMTTFRFIDPPTAGLSLRDDEESPEPEMF